MVQFKGDGSCITAKRSEAIMHNDIAIVIMVQIALTICLKQF